MKNITGDIDEVLFFRRYKFGLHGTSIRDIVIGKVWSPVDMRVTRRVYWPVVEDYWTYHDE